MIRDLGEQVRGQILIDRACSYEILKTIEVGEKIACFRISMITSYITYVFPRFTRISEKQYSCRPSGHNFFLFFFFCGINFVCLFSSFFPFFTIQVFKFADLLLQPNHPWKKKKEKKICWTWKLSKRLASSTCSTQMDLFWACPPVTRYSHVVRVPSSQFANLVGETHKLGPSLHWPSSSLPLFMEACLMATMSYLLHISS